MFSSYDQDLPCDCDDEYWNNPDPDQAFKQPPGKLSKLAFWTEFLKLLRILGIAQRTIVSEDNTRCYHSDFLSIQLDLPN